MSSSLITVKSSYNNHIRAMLVLYVCDPTLYAKNKYIQREFHLPWHGKLIICRTASHNANQLVNLQGREDSQDVHDAIGS